jgi:hypothetical protein
MGIEDYDTVDELIDAGYSTAMDLEELTMKYNAYLIVYEILLVEYQKLLTNYPSGNFPYTAFKSSQYLGTSVGTPTVVSSPNDCITGCGSTAGCTGATYNSTNQTCSFVSGYGNIFDASSNFTAFVQANIAYLVRMQEVNTELLSTNTQILNLTENGQTVYTDSEGGTELNSVILNQQNNLLNKQRVELEEKIKSYDALKRELTQSNINTTQNYTSYLLLLFVVILLIILMVMFSSSSSTTTMNNTVNQQGGKLSISAYLFVFIIILVTIVIKYYSRISSFIKSFKL